MNGVLALTWFEHRCTRELCAGLVPDLCFSVQLTAYAGSQRYASVRMAAECFGAYEAVA
jgi:hypothetical protein